MLRKCLELDDWSEFRMTLCGVFYCVDSEKVLISVDHCQERELLVELSKCVVETRPGRFQNGFFFLIYAHCSNCFMRFIHLFQNA